jgi:hypothetical protein
MNKKLLIAIFLTYLLIAGCSRGTGDTAASHLGKPEVVQIQAEGHFPVLLQGRTEVQKLTKILKGIKVRPLTVEEELDLVLKDGGTLGAIELNFKDSSASTYKALLLTDGSLLVVDGARASETRRQVFLSEPEQADLTRYINELFSP